jgi:hypothetical protein
MLTAGAACVAVDVAYLGCASLTPEEVWLIQMLLPLWYPVIVFVIVVVDYFLALLANCSFPPTGCMMAWGWVPEREWSWARMSERFVPPALFFFNLYYYMGFSTALVMIDCKPTDDGKHYVRDLPYITCYEGDHNTYLTLAWIGVFIYVIGVPLWYCRVFFVLVPREGYDDVRMISRYGFLYRRFQPRFLYWELVEMVRKFLFIIVGFVDSHVIIQSFLALMGVAMV